MGGLEEDSASHQLMPQVNNSESDMDYNFEMGDINAMFNCLKNLPNTNNTGNSFGDGSVLPPDCMQDFSDHQSEYDLLKQTEYKAPVIILYIITIILCVVGNTLVVLTVIKTKAMWNATNIFIANLAVADVFVGIFVLPFSAYYQLTSDWIFGAPLCHVIPMAFGVVVYSSTLTLTLIAIDRYMLIIHPMAKRISVSIALILILVIIILALSAALPIAIYSKYQEHEDPVLMIKRTRYCIEDWPSPKQRQLYTVLTLILQFFLPLIIIAILYLRIFLRISQRISTQNKNSRRTKTTKMLIAVVSVFAVAWTPYHINSILMDFHHPAPVEYIKFIDAVLRVFAMSSSCTNPILYGWLNDNFRNAFLSIIKRPTATPVGIRNEESQASKKHNAVQSPMRKFYKKITNIGGQSQNGKEHNSGSQMINPESVPLQTVVVDCNGQGIVCTKENAEKNRMLDMDGNGALLGKEKVQIEIPTKEDPSLTPELTCKEIHSAHTPLIERKC